MPRWLIRDGMKEAQRRRLNDSDAESGRSFLYCGEKLPRKSILLSTFKQKPGNPRVPESLHPLFDIRRHRNPTPRHLPQLQNLLQPQPAATLRMRRNPLPYLLAHHHLKPIVLVRRAPENTPRARVGMRALRRAAVVVTGFWH